MLESCAGRGRTRLDLDTEAPLGGRLNRGKIISNALELAGMSEKDEP